MTVASTENRKTYAGNGATTSFATSPVVFFETSDLTVYVVVDSTQVATELTENTHYTVSGGDGSTGTVNTAGGSSPHGAVASGSTLVIVRRLSIVQEADPENNDNSDADVIETALDKLTMMVQQVANDSDRTIRLADSDTSSADLELPTPSAGKILGWNDDGDGLVNYAAADIDAELVTAFAATILDDTTAAEVRTTLGLVIGTNVQAYDADLGAIAALTSAADKMPYSTGAQAWALTDLSSFARTLLDDTTAAAARATLAMPFANTYVSAQQTIAQAGAGSSPLAHGLGVVPTLVTMELVCTDAGGEAGYTQNQVVQLPAIDYTASQGVSIIKDATNLTIRFGNNANVFSIPHATTGTATVLTNTKWAAVFRAWGPAA